MNTSWMGDLPPYSHNQVPTWDTTKDLGLCGPYSIEEIAQFNPPIIAKSVFMFDETTTPPLPLDFEPQLIDLSKEELVDMIEELRKSNDFLQSQRLEERMIINSLMERLDKISRIINTEAYI